jgi:hypothetical protein
MAEVQNKTEQTKGRESVCICMYVCMYVCVCVKHKTGRERWIGDNQHFPVSPWIWNKNQTGGWNGKGREDNTEQQTVRDQVKSWIIELEIDL